MTGEAQVQAEETTGCVQNAVGGALREDLLLMGEDWVLALGAPQGIPPTQRRTCWLENFFLLSQKIFRGFTPHPMPHSTPQLGK